MSLDSEGSVTIASSPRDASRKLKHDPMGNVKSAVPTRGLEQDKQ
jgi:hypothetical protein